VFRIRTPLGTAACQQARAHLIGPTYQLINEKYWTECGFEISLEGPFDFARIESRMQVH
jgi:hypothetical protein